MYQGQVRITMLNAKTGKELAKTFIDVHQALRQGSELRVKGYKTPMLDARDEELGIMYTMIKNQGLFVHPDRIAREQAGGNKVQSALKVEFKEREPVKKIYSKEKEDIFIDSNIQINGEAVPEGMTKDEYMRK